MRKKIGLYWSLYCGFFRLLFLLPLLLPSIDLKPAEKIGSQVANSTQSDLALWEKGLPSSQQWHKPRSSGPQTLVGTLAKRTSQRPPSAGSTISEHPTKPNPHLWPVAPKLAKSTVECDRQNRSAINPVKAEREGTETSLTSPPTATALYLIDLQFFPDIILYETCLEQRLRDCSPRVVPHLFLKIVPN
jgi:hypothetical protein